ncbi:Rv0909 family putative TA system antitoxin [Pseudonocardia sp. H11422]|uniref:Rv0909 family putative TA system antitoxin n=1 Tax=Pseudonocardia sp. H11422 TaxID=2835866 RepID=UPI001BDDB9A8|nr:Rv0909 family putative TA system antitoxin [Pseudonocardia sp. H11422]
MVDFNALRGKAEELLNEHGDKVEGAAEKVGDLVKGKFGHDEQVDQVVDKLKDLIPDGPGGAQPPTTGQ